MRPKSIATVVVVLLRTWVRSSIPSDSSVIRASVLSGGISETAPTNVVLPTPNPPAMMILTGTGGSRRSTPTKSLQQSFQDLGGRWPVRLAGQVHDQVVAGGEVADQHPRHAEGHL